MKTAKMCLWVFLPMIFITGASMEGRDAALFSSLENGGFVFKTNQVQLDQMEGKANFFYREASSSKGFHSIEIVFEDVLDHKGYKMGLTLKKEDRTNQGPIGYYKIDSKTLGFIPDNNGAFGYADVSILGEQPYYTKSGTINITHANEKVLHGIINLSLENFQEGNLKVTGNFIATLKEASSIE
ncbi:hypothetical protein [Euzebyella saccharophila]|uniref:DUF3224 domain-containing protein n=2 Tax=Euzebyella saccharophila TaxID=679664 RepID=A0ABV8JW37_9FLAO|nr:hypothetical protein [Euzebyella saccharophila]